MKHLPALASSIMAKLKENHRCLYLQSPEMVTAMTLYLRSAGLDVVREVNRGALILSSDQDHLESGKFDVDRMLDMLEAAVQKALDDGYSGLWATGDMTWEFGPEKRLGNLVAYECGLQDLFREYPAFGGVCQYHIDTLPANAVHQALRTHRSVYFNETLSRLNPFYGPDDVSVHVVSTDIQEPLDIQKSADTKNEMLRWLRHQNC